MHKILMALFCVYIVFGGSQSWACDILFLYPTEVKTIELNKAIGRMQNGDKAAIESTPQDELASFYYRKSGNIILFEGRIVGTSYDNGPSLIFIRENILGDKLPQNIPVEVIKPGSMGVVPVISAAQIRETAIRVREAYEKNEQITFKEIRFSQIWILRNLVKLSLSN